MDRLPAYQRLAIMGSVLLDKPFDVPSGALQSVGEVWTCLCGIDLIV